MDWIETMFEKHFFFTFSWQTSGWTWHSKNGEVDADPAMWTNATISHVYVAQSTACTVNVICTMHCKRNLQQAL
jgi:hypothetical protein